MNSVSYSEVMELGCGATFSDFLSLMFVNGDTVDLCKYYQACKSVSFDRQVGS